MFSDIFLLCITLFVLILNTCSHIFRCFLLSSCSTDLPILTAQHPLFCSFLENIETRSKGYGSPGPANGRSPSSGSQSPTVPPSGASTGSSSPGTPHQPTIPAQVPGLQAPSPSPPPPALAAGMVSPTAELQSPTLTQAQSPEHPGPSPLPPASGPAQAPPPQKRGLISRLFGSAPTPEVTATMPGESDWCFSVLLLRYSK